MPNEIILVNELDNMVGTMEKMEAHRKGLLHRAFSVFIFNDKGELLLQQRAFDKYHSAGLWTNSCCSHPAPGEATKDAAIRRTFEELGFQVGLEEIFHFTYKHHFDNGLTEFEYDHVFTGFYNAKVKPDPAEVADFRFVSVPQLDSDLIKAPEKFTAWFHIAWPLVREWVLDKQSVQNQNLQ